MVRRSSFCSSASVIPGVLGQTYAYPTHAEVDYFVGKGMNMLRIPFLWERMQPTLSGPLDDTQLGLIPALQAGMLPWMRAPLPPRSTPRAPETDQAALAAFARSARFRSFGSRMTFLSLIDFGVTSTSSSSPI